jgi:YVTN family beta-propeller protein
LLFSFACQAQPVPREFLLAISKANRTLAFVDPKTHTVTAKVPLGEDPHEVTVSADGKLAYVSIYGGGELHTINVIDLKSQKRLDDIDTRPLYGPHGLVFVNNKLWFSAEGSKAVASYTPVSHSIDWSMGTGQDATHMIYVSNDAKKIYTTNMASGTVSILEEQSAGNMRPNMQPHGNWKHTLITVSPGSEGFDVSPDSAELWTASSQDGKIYIINLTDKKLKETIDAHVNGANRLKFTPDGKLVFISSLGSDILTVYDATTHKLVKQLNIGGAAGIQMAPDGTRAYVACSAKDYIAVIELKTLTVINKLDVGGRPDGLAWNLARE